MRGIIFLLGLLLLLSGCPRQQTGARIAEKGVVAPVWSTYFGGAANTGQYDVAVTPEGDVIIAGTTVTPDLPTKPGAIDEEYDAGFDGFVAKLSGDDASLEWVTYFGGPGYDSIDGVTVAPTGDILLTGHSDGGLPLPSGPLDDHTGATDFFVALINSTGTVVNGGAYIGGTSSELAYERNSSAIDANGNIYITGFTQSDDLPVSNNAFQKTRSGDYDAFVVKLTPNLRKVKYCSYLGGSEEEKGLGLAVDAKGCAYAIGTTKSDNFPTTENAYDTTWSGDQDAFVAKINKKGTKLNYCTLVGHKKLEYAWDLALTAQKEVIFSGSSHSPRFPVKNGAYDTKHNGGSDIIVAKLNAKGSKLKAATFLGGSGGDISFGMALDASGNVRLSGSTSSPDLPVSMDAMQADFQGGEHDSFVAVLDNGLKSLLYLSYLGGTHDDGSGHVAIAPNGDAIVACITTSDDFPTTEGAYQTENTEGIAAATVTRFDIPLAR